MALPQEHYLVAAGASWSRKSPKRNAESHFDGTGLDDRGDHLRWLSVRAPSRGLWMEVTVVDASAAAAPRRQPRRRMDWRDHFANMRARDVKRTEELESRLRQVRLGTYRVQSWASRPAALAFQVILNGRELGRIGVGDPGSVSVTVCAKRHHDERIAFLSAHGGDFVGPQTWRWFQWPWAERRLETGDRVRIEVVPPLGLSRNRLRELQTNDLTSAAAISRELKELRRRLKSDRHREEAAGMIQSERERLPPRRYPRG